MHKPESIQENEAHKILWDYEILKDHFIMVRRPDLVLINKKENLPSSGFYCSARPLSKNKKAKNWINTWTLPEN